MIAKRKEAQRDECVDYVMTFEELHPLFRGLGIELEQATPYKVARESVCEAHGFAQTGGVAGAVQAYLGPKAQGIKVLQFSDFQQEEHRCTACIRQDWQGRCPVHRNDGLRRRTRYGSECPQRSCFRPSSA